MRLNSARDAWHDAYYTPWDSTMSHAIELARLGSAVQKTERDRRTPVAIHQALAGHVQRAIDSLQEDLRRYGHHLYNPLATKGDMVAANLLVWRSLQLPRMTKAKQEKAFLVCCGVIYRYRRMHQGGQSEGIDPCPSAESFRAWMLAECKVSLPSENWGRDWSPFVEVCFAACDDLDRQALAPVAAVLGELKEAA